MYGLVIVHEDGCVLSVRVPEAEARYRFEESQKEKSVVYSHFSNEDYQLINCFTRSWA